MRIALCQINTTVGDFSGNAARIQEAAAEAAAQEADLALFPELTIAGYPPEDLLLKPRFVQQAMAAAAGLATDLPLPCLIGSPWQEAPGGPVTNAACLLADGRLTGIYSKVCLPNYAVFDEKRYFAPGRAGLLVDTGAHRLGVIICEDAWEEDSPARTEAAAGATCLLCLSASPFHRQKGRLREETFARLVRACACPMLYCNLVGGQDELVFDGTSLVLDAHGTVTARGPAFAEAVFCTDLPAPTANRPPEPSAVTVTVVPLPLSSGPKAPPAAPEATPSDALTEIYECLILGVRDYVRKNGFAKAVIGLSGGIDSALTAVIAAEALGRENVTGVSLPSRYSSDATRADAERLAVNLGIDFHVLPIGSAYKAFHETLEPLFAGREADLTEENLQARVRAVYLMALANKFGWLVLNTSNKSEAAVGYGTMYGDMIGAYGVLKDVFKTTVFALARLANKRHGRAVIPTSTLERPPTAELRADQRDSDSIPEYDVLDPVLEAYIEQDRSIDEMLADGFDAEVVRRAVQLTDAAEWKRRQSVPGVRVTPKAFGKDRRLPITSRYRA